MKKVLAWFLCAATALAASAGAELMTIGSQGRVVGYPFRGNAGVDAVRCQDLVLATELWPWDAARVNYIMKWEWYAAPTVSPGTFNNFTIKICRTTRTTLTTDFNANYAGQTPIMVYSRRSQPINAEPGKWFGFDFDSQFNYGFGYNVIVEVEWSGDNGGYAYTYRSAATARCVFNYNGGTPVVHDYVHYMRVTIEFIPGVEPTSLGRVRALYL
ncbi:MAG TPA: hypothetical protein VMX79_12955 [bacterium]|nr:hypothetical protein [bacterium]